jgi:glutamate dehydrogenase (NADP+)
MVRHGCIAVGEGANMPTTPDACGAPGNYVVGANVAAFTRVADAMLALGMVQASSPRRG